jgi:transcriptional regulator GlxA family with amidase domain
MNPMLLDFVATRAKTCKAILSVCTGAFVLHAAGLLNGKKATTHWGSIQRMRALGNVTVVEERFVQDGNIWSAAGISAGIDATLAFIAAIAGEESAAKVQFASEYYPSTKRYGSFHKTHPSAPAYARDA